MRFKKNNYLLFLSILIIIPLLCSSCGNNNNEKKEIEDPQFSFTVVHSNKKTTLKEANNKDDKAIIFVTRQYIHVLNHGNFDDLWKILDKNSYNYNTQKNKWRNDIWKKFVSHYIEEIFLKTKDKNSAEVILKTKNIKILPFIKKDNTILIQSIKLKKTKDQWYINNIQEIKKEIITEKNKN